MADIIFGVIVRHIDWSCGMNMKTTVDSQNYIITLYIVGWVLKKNVSNDSGLCCSRVVKRRRSQVVRAAWFWKVSRSS